MNSLNATLTYPDAPFDDLRKAPHFFVTERGELMMALSPSYYAAREADQVCTHQLVRILYATYVM